MGGRGARLAIGPTRGTKSESESRSGVIELFDRYGMRVRDTGAFPAAVIGAYAIALNELDKKFGVIKEMDVAVVGAGAGDMSKAGAVAEVQRYPNAPFMQTLRLNQDALSNVTKANEVARNAQSMNWWLKTAPDIKSVSRQVVTHEYGHILENYLALKQRQANPSGFSHNVFAMKARSEILNIARSRYNFAWSDMSQYGKTNQYEFFAEAFMNSQSGRPNSVGKAMNDWLKEQGFNV